MTLLLRQTLNLNPHDRLSKLTKRRMILPMLAELAAKSRGLSLLQINHLRRRESPVLEFMLLAFNVAHARYVVTGQSPNAIIAADVLRVEVNVHTMQCQNVGVLTRLLAPDSERLGMLMLEARATLLRPVGGAEKNARSLRPIHFRTKRLIQTWRAINPNLNPSSPSLIFPHQSSTHS
jgi:hypothetical protein